MRHLVSIEETHIYLKLYKLSNKSYKLSRHDQRNCNYPQLH